jgi:hypothetical protein
LSERCRILTSSSHLRDCCLRQFIWSLQSLFSRKIVWDTSDRSSISFRLSCRAWLSSQIEIESVKRINDREICSIRSMIDLIIASTSKSLIMTYNLTASTLLITRLHLIEDQWIRCYAPVPSTGTLHLAIAPPLSDQAKLAR